MRNSVVRFVFLVAAMVGVLGFKGLQIRLEAFSTGQSHLVSGHDHTGAPSGGRGGKVERPPVLESEKRFV